VARRRRYADTFAWLRDELVGSLRAQLPVDAVLLACTARIVAETGTRRRGEVLAGVRH